MVFNFLNFIYIFTKKRVSKIRYTSEQDGRGRGEEDEGGGKGRGKRERGGEEEKV